MNDDFSPELPAQESNEIIRSPVKKELSDSYLSYAMSVIVSRAVPDVRDGLKPVHRRIIYAMYKGGYIWSSAYKKSARVVGDVIGKYHPHGDSPAYDALVRMAQDFSLLLPIVDGQGNFGSIDGDPPASMRYTEARLAKMAEFIVRDLDKETVKMCENYDGSEHEPEVLPVEFPNILLNGASGVAVGMATNIPSHNLAELVDVCCLHIDKDGEVDINDLMNIMPGPDFPTGGSIVGVNGIQSAFLSGRGSLVIRGKTHFETIGKSTKAIVIDEIPYQVNKSRLVEGIGQLIRDKKIDSISDLRDESDMKGIRVVIELKRNVVEDVALNQILHLTQLQNTFGVNMVVLDKGRPSLKNLKEILDSFVEFRFEVVTKRVSFNLRKAREKAFIVLALYVSIQNIDDVISIIRSSSDTSAATKSLLEKKWFVKKDIIQFAEVISGIDISESFYRFNNIQVKAILEMRLHRLTSLESDKLKAELVALLDSIKDCMDILSSRQRVKDIIKQELYLVKEKFGSPRKTTIELVEFEQDVESLIPHESMMVTTTVGGYVKRVNLSNYRTQNRGGKGKSNSSNKNDDIVSRMFTADTHSSVLFFSNLGQVYRLKVYKLPLVEPQSRGRAFVNLFPLSDGESINNVMLLPDDFENMLIVFVTANGNVRKNSLSDFAYIPSNGKIAIRLKEGDSLVSVHVCNPSDHIMISTKYGKTIRFPSDDVRVFKGRTSDGVRGIKLLDDDSVISMSIVNGFILESEVREEYLSIPVSKRVSGFPDENKYFSYANNEQFILTVTENGFGKRSSAYEYRTTARGGVGVLNIATSKRNGNVVSSFPVEIEDDVMLVTDKGQVIRISISGIRITGRNAQGVTLLKTKNGEKVVGVAKVVRYDDVHEEPISE